MQYLQCTRDAYVHRHALLHTCMHARDSSDRSNLPPAVTGFSRSFHRRTSAWALLLVVPHICTDREARLPFLIRPLSTIHGPVKFAGG